MSALKYNPVVLVRRSLDEMQSRLASKGWVLSHLREEGPKKDPITVAVFRRSINWEVKRRQSRKNKRVRVAYAFRYDPDLPVDYSDWSWFTG